MNFFKHLGLPMTSNSPRRYRVRPGQIFITKGRADSAYLIKVTDTQGTDSLREQEESNPVLTIDYLTGKHKGTTYPFYTRERYESFIEKYKPATEKDLDKIRKEIKNQENKIKQAKTLLKELNTLLRSKP